MTLRMASPTNGYLPVETGQVVAFVRDPAEFKINRYCQMVKSDDGPVGVFAKLGRDESVRVVTDEEFSWEDGGDMPSGDAYKSRFDTVEFRCKRRAYPWTVGSVTDATAKLWKPKLTQMKEAISVAMTNRTWQIIQAMESTTNFSGFTATANALNGGRGKWPAASDDPQSPAYMAIAQTFLRAAQSINLYTNSVVKIKDIICVISPGLATDMGLSGEIKNFVRESRFARQQQEDPYGNVNQMWGLPPSYQGIEIVVEDASRVSERAKVSGTEATTNRAYLKSDTSAVFVSRPGGLDGDLSSKSFSTVQCFYYQDLLRVKQEYDSWNEKIKGAVTEYFVPKIAAAPAGYLVTAVK